RQQVTGLAAVGQALVGAGLVEHAHGRTQVRAAGAGAPVGDHAVGDAGGFVGLLTHRDAVHQVLGAHAAADFREDGRGVGVPFGQALALLDRVAVLDPDPGAVRSLVGLPVLAVDLDGDDQVAAHGDQVAVDGRDRRAAAHLGRAIVGGL